MSRISSARVFSATFWYARLCAFRTWFRFFRNPSRSVQYRTVELSTPSSRATARPLMPVPNIWRIDSTVSALTGDGRCRDGRCCSRWTASVKVGGWLTAKYSLYVAIRMYMFAARCWNVRRSFTNCPHSPLDTCRWTSSKISPTMTACSNQTLVAASTACWWCSLAFRAASLRNRSDTTNSPLPAVITYQLAVAVRHADSSHNSHVGIADVPRPVVDDKLVGMVGRPGQNFLV